MFKVFFLMITTACSLFPINKAIANSELLVRVSNIDANSQSPLGFEIKDSSLQKTCYISSWLKPGDSITVNMDQLRPECKNQSVFKIIASNQISIGNSETIHRGQSCALMYWPGQYIQCW